MKFYQKLVLAFFLFGLIIASTLCITGYLALKEYIKENLIEKYNTALSNLSINFIEFDRVSELVGINAVNALKITDEHHIPSNEELKKAASDLSINHFYITNSKGEFIRSTNGPIPGSIFNYCEGYKNLIYGNANLFVTPIMPSSDEPVLAFNKYIMMPNYNRTRILEASINFDFIGNFLKNILENNKDFISLSLYTPTNVRLGYVARNSKENSKDSLSISKTFDTSEKFCCECAAKGISLPDGKYYYRLVANISTKKINQVTTYLLLIVFGIFLLSIILCLFLARFLAKMLVARIQTLQEKINNIMTDENADTEIHVNGNDEISYLSKHFRQLLNKLKDNERKLALAEKSKALAMIATQVAHDIRSPLLVLTTVLNDLSHLPEKKRIDVRNAIQRVSDIANNLLAQYRMDKQPSASDKSAPAQAPEVETLSSEPIAMLLESIVSEKRLQTAELGIDIQLQLSPSAHTAFARVDITGFKRVLSNLMNNAVEAVRDQKNQKGLVTLALDKRDKKVLIDIQDNGPGIPPDKLEKLLNEGGSFGKKEGSGLGLPYAMHKISAWQGSYTLASAPDTGTTFSMQLPEAPTPPWFQDTIRVVEHGSIVILDDDDYIHHIWEERFPEDFLKAHHLTIHHFNNPPDFIRFCESHDANHTIFLLDYDLKTYTDTGQSLAEQLHIGPKATLVSSRYEDLDIRAKCLSLGMKIIPKYLAEQTPIRVLPKPIPTEVVFIDDNTAITDIWKESAEDAGKTISVFNDPRDFLAVADAYSKETLIYIDSELNDGLKGEDIAKTLFDQGFKQLYLATGHPKDHFTHVTWVKDILGKEPPWM